MTSADVKSQDEQMPRVFIVILNWNGRDDTLACLKSVQEVDYPNFKILVVDNGSSDDSVSAIREHHTPVEIIETGANLGFAGGNNVGIKRALALGADYVLLLNNDTEVDTQLLRAFIAAAKRHPNAGAMSARIYYYSDPHRIWYAGGKWSPDLRRFIQIGEGALDTGTEFSTEIETDYACGCAFFVSAKRLRELGNLDDDFFLYFEETDWCYRARKAGYPSFFVPDAKVQHKVSASFGGEKSPLLTYFITRNRLLWAKRHLAFRQRWIVYTDSVRNLFRRYCSLPIKRIHSISPRQIWWSITQAFCDVTNRAYFMGLRDFCLRRFGDCPDEVRTLTKEWAAKKGEDAKLSFISQHP